jgi:hypothetical protein
MKTLTLISIITLFSSLSFAQATDTGRRCGSTSPSFCVGEKVAFPGYHNSTITGVLSNGTYQVSGAYYSSYPPEKIGKTTGCGKTNPRFCANEKVVFPGYHNATIIGYTSEGSYIVSGAYYSSYTAEKIGKTKGCSNTTPRFCANERVGVNGYPNAIALGYTSEGAIIVESAYYSSYTADKLGKVRSRNSNSVDGLSVYLSTDTEDVTLSYSALASVTTKERADFLNSSSAYLKQLNSEDVNIFAGMVLAKIIRLSTSQVVKDHFETPAVAFTAELAKNNWKSIDQIEANLRTLDFATRVIYAAVKLKLTMAQADPKDNQDLLQLGQIAAMTQLSRKIAALQQFCESKRHIVEELIQDPRHGVLGMVTADVMGWVLSK